MGIEPNNIYKCFSIIKMGIVKLLLTKCFTPILRPASARAILNGVGVWGVLILYIVSGVLTSSRLLPANLYVKLGVTKVSVLIAWSPVSSFGLVLQLGNKRLTGVDDELTTSNDNDGLFKN